jgi:adenine deaminase
MAFCTDDREPEHVVDEGHINSMVRRAVEQGIEPEDAIILATLNPATWHGLGEHGAVAPGYKADLLVLGDLERFEPELVLKSGRRVGEIARPDVPEWVKHTVRIQPVGRSELALPANGGNVRVIGIVPDQIVTESLVEESSATSARGASGPAWCAASASGAARSRRPSRTTRTTSSWSASTTTT